MRKKQTDEARESKVNTYLERYNQTVLKPSEQIAKDILKLIGDDDEIKDGLEYQIKLLGMPRIVLQNLAYSFKIPEETMTPKAAISLFKANDAKDSVRMAQDTFKRIEQGIKDDWQALHTKNPNLPAQYDGSEIQQKFENLDELCKISSSFIDIIIPKLVAEIGMKTEFSKAR